MAAVGSSVLRAGMVGLGMIFDETYRPFFERAHAEGLWDKRFGPLNVGNVGLGRRLDASS